MPNQAHLYRRIIFGGRPRPCLGYLEMWPMLNPAGGVMDYGSNLRISCRNIVTN